MWIHAIPDPKRCIVNTFVGLFASLFTGTYIKFSLQPRVEGAAQKTPSTCGNQEVMLAGRLTHHSQ